MHTARLTLLATCAPPRDCAGCLRRVLPVSGEVVAVNEDLADSPGKVNEGAYTDGWMMKVKMSNPAELDSLMDAAAYEKSCE